MPNSRFGENRPSGVPRWLVAGVAGVAGLLLVIVLAFAVAQSRSARKEKPRDKPSRQLPQPPEQAFALSFNGATSYVSVPDLVPEAGETYTLEVVARPQVFRTCNLISWLGPDWMALYLDDGGHFGLARRFRGVSYLVQTQEPLAVGETVHLAGIYRGADLSLFVNGRSVDSGPITFPLTETRGGLYLGGVPRDRFPGDQNDRCFRGLIDAVRISRGIRYEQPFEPPARLETDRTTIALFSFDEGRGEETRGAGERAWAGQIVDATWQRTSD